MKIKITIKCPNCTSKNIIKNGKKENGKQNYLCKKCNRQFIGDHALTYKGAHSDLSRKIALMLVRGVGIRDIAEIENISIQKILSVLVNSNKIIQPKKSHYDALEIDEFWTYVGKKSRRIWLIYAYHRESGEIVAFVWGKRDYKTVNRLRQKLQRLGITYNKIYTDKWNVFKRCFKSDNHIIGKKYTKGIEGNNCRLRHRIRRVYRKTCCFSKKLLNHLKAFNLAFFYINHGYI